MPKPDLYLTDLFAGGGGFSTGISRACKRISKRPDLLAINHWDIAVKTHKLNHPWARHLCTGLESVTPTEVSASPRLNLLSASPECTHHSLARGGKPMSDQSRSSAWLILKWLQELYVDAVLIENVQEFMNWGPLGANGRPMVSLKGALFQQFIASLKALGYTVEIRILNAADYGGATTRERLFIMAWRGKQRRYWPDPTHCATADQQISLFGQKKQWRPAREIIDWSLPSQSIFTRPKPLAPATIERIAAGLRKFGGKNAEPFLVMLRNHMRPRSVDEPLPTLTAGGNHVGLCEPFLFNMQRKQDRHYSTDEPMPTITATSSDYGFCEPFIVTAGGATGQGRHPKSLDDPLPTVLTNDRHALVQPYLLSMEHSKGRKVSPFVIPTNHGSGDHRVYDIDRPMPTVTTVDAWGVVEPFITSYYGTTNVSRVGDPLPTCTAKARFGLVEMDGLQFDIRFRMLQWHELAAAMGFPPEYQFAGNREQKVKQIGNAVEVHTAESLALAALAA